MKSSVSLTSFPASSVTLPLTTYFISANSLTSLAGTVIPKLPSLPTLPVYSFPFKVIVTTCPASIPVVVVPVIVKSFHVLLRLGNHYLFS